MIMIMIIIIIIFNVELDSKLPNKNTNHIQLEKDTRKETVPAYNVADGRCSGGFLCRKAREEVGTEI